MKKVRHILSLPCIIFRYGLRSNSISLLRVTVMPLVTHYNGQLSVLWTSLTRLRIFFLWNDFAGHFCNPQKIFSFKNYDFYRAIVIDDEHHRHYLPTLFSFRLFGELFQAKNKNLKKWLKNYEIWSSFVYFTSDVSI